MKIVTFGKEIQNNKRTRYALIMMKLDRKTGESVDDTTTFVYSNNVKELLETKTKLLEISMNNTLCRLDINIFDYQECHYVKGY